LLVYLFVTEVRMAQLGECRKKIKDKWPVR